MNDLTRLLFFLRLISVGEIATWVFLHWKGRAQFLNLSLFMDLSNQLTNYNDYKGNIWKGAHCKNRPVMVTILNGYNQLQKVILT